MTSNNAQRILLQDRVKLLQKQIMESKSPHLHKFLAKEVKTEEIWGMTCQEVLITAALKGVQSIVLWLIEQGVDVNASGAEGFTGFTALMLAVIGGHESIVRLLINAGANVNTRGAVGLTALMLAAKGGHQAITRLLIEQGADIDVMDDCHFTALTHATFNSHEAIVRLLIKQGADYINLLLVSAFESNEAAVKLLIEQGANINARAEGLTALIIAAQEGHESIVKFLINQGANVNIRGAEGETALMKALIWGHKVIFEHLIRNGANIYLQDNTGESIIDQIDLFPLNKETQSKYITLCCFGEKNKQIIKNKEGKKLAELFPTIYEKITKKEKEIAENYGFFRQEGSNEIDYRKLRDWFLLSVNEKATTVLLARGGLLIGDGRKECPIEICSNILSFIVPSSLSRHEYPKIATISDDVSNIPEDLPLRSYTPGSSKVV